MDSRQLGNDGPYLSEVGLGTWAIGGPWDWGWGPQADEESIATIHRALEAGINWIDTAAVYGLGHSEEVVSRAIGDHRPEVFIATKCGLIWDDRGRVRRSNRPQSIRQECEASLRRLNTDYIDLYQIHWPDPDTPVEDSWGEMVRLKEEGKARFIGVCNFDVELLEKCEALHHVTSLQPPYSLVHRVIYPEVEEKILPWCQEKGIGVVAYSPLQNGLLTGKFTRQRLEQLPGDDWRHKSEFFKEPLFSQILAFVERLKQIAERYGRSLAEMAIAWVLGNPSVTSAIVGARKPEQVDQNIGGAGWRIADDDLQTIERITREVFG